MSGRIDTDGPVRVVVETEEFESASLLGEGGPPTHVWDCFRELVPVPRVVPPFKGALVLEPAGHPNESEIFSDDGVFSVEGWLAAVREFVSGHPHGEVGILPTDGASVVSRVRLSVVADGRERELTLQLFWGKPDEAKPPAWNFAGYKPGEVTWGRNTFVLRQSAAVGAAA